MLGIGLILAQVAAGQIAITASAPATVAACEAIEVRVTTSGPGGVAPHVVPPSLAPFQVIRRRITPTVRITAGGEPWVTVDHVYLLAADRAGTFRLAPFRAEMGGVAVASRPLTIVVRDTPTPSLSGVAAVARADTSRDVNFTALAVPDTVYVGQQVRYEVAVVLKEAVRERLRRNPTFYPPDMPGMLAYDLPAARGEPPRRQVGGRCFDALVYTRAIFPLQAGRTVIPPAQLMYSVPHGPGLFSREVSHELRTDSVVVVAIDPPARGRPADDLGAVGTLDVGARVDTTRGRVGDPLTLTVRVSGEANVKLLPRPRLEVSWGSLVPDGERVQMDSAGRRVRGAKEFDWLVTPRQSGRVVVPAVRYPHFDPAVRRYVVARTEPLALEIESAPLVRLDTVVARRRLALRTTYRGPLGRPLHAHPAVWFLAAIAPLPAVIRTVGRRRPRTAPPASPALGLTTLAEEPAVDARQVRRAFVAALADRLCIPAAVFTRAGAVERTLRRSGVTRELAREAEAFLRELDSAAYGGAAGSYDARGAARAARRLYARVDAEALDRWELGPVASLGLVLAFTVVAAGTALAWPAGDATEFAGAVRAYGNGSFVAAADGFERLALREPRAPDAWANFGTASWEASDTAGAIAGWQRALRLEPAADDMRRRLDAVRFVGVGDPGYVPPVGVAPLALTALTAWLVACGLAMVHPTLGSALRGLSAGAGAAAVLLVGLAVITDERLAARHAVVLRHATGLSASPAIGARRTVRAATGEVGIASAREGGWTFVRFDDARAGWVPASEVVSIARAPRRSD